MLLRLSVLGDRVTSTAPWWRCCPYWDDGAWGVEGDLLNSTYNVGRPALAEYALLKDRLIDGGVRVLAERLELPFG